jgi:hypothetical protein
MPDLPSGTVTFLFTDIEGSTALDDARAWSRAGANSALAIRSLLSAWPGPGQEVAVITQRHALVPFPL